MSDPITLSSGPLATLPAGTVLELPVDGSGTRYPGGWGSYAMATGSGSWIFQIIDSLGHGMPVNASGSIVAIASGGTIPVQLQPGAVVSVASGVVQVMSGGTIPVQLQSGSIVSLTSGVAVALISGTTVGITSGGTIPVIQVSGSILQVHGLSPAGNPVSGNPIPIGVKDFSGNVQVAAGNTAGDQFTLPPNLQAVPLQLFDFTTNQFGPAQTGVFFPSSGLSGILPAIGTGSINTLTCSGNVCGAVFSPKPEWDSVLLDVIGVGGTSTNLLAFEIGRIAASGAIPQVLWASGTLSASTLTLGATTVNPFTGAGGHASVTWRYFDAVASLSRAQLGEVLVDIGGTTGGGPMQLRISVHDVSYVYFLVTALNANFTEVLAVITPIS